MKESGRMSHLSADEDSVLQEINSEDKKLFPEYVGPIL